MNDLLPDLARVRELMEKVKDDCRLAMDAEEAAAEFIVDHAAGIEAMARDAERYRALTSPGFPSGTQGGAHVIVNGRYGLTVAESKDELDAAIDAAMEARR